MDHLRIRPDIDTDPRLEEAGWGASRVYELLLKISGQYDLKGRLPPEKQRPGWLAKRWNLMPADLPGVKPEDFITVGLTRLLQVGVVRREGSDVVISAWAKWYGGVKTGAERQAAYEERPGQIYVIQAEKDGPVKIGFSANAGARIN